MFSPQNVFNAGRKEDEKLPDFYSDLKRTSEEMDLDNGSETSEDDPDFVDLEYEVDAEDDYLFTDNVDDGVIEGVAIGNKFRKGKKSIRFTDADADDTTDEGEDLDLLDSDGEGEVRMRF